MSSLNQNKMNLNQFFKKLTLQGRIPHGTLLVCENEDTLRKGAYETSAFFINSQDHEKTIQTIEKKINPDVWLLEKEKKEISIEEVKEMIKWIRLLPNQHTSKVAIIFQAHTLGRSAANALLKILEEPPLHSKIILCSPRVDFLMPTLISRLFIFRLSHTLSHQETPAYDWSHNLNTFFKQKTALSPSYIFELSDTISKNKEDLPGFFEIFLNQIRMSFQDLAVKNKSTACDHLFRETLIAENEIVRKYGNASLWISSLLFLWNEINLGDPLGQQN